MTKLKSSGDTQHLRRVRCFMAGDDWQHNLGNEALGTKMYPGKKSLIVREQERIDLGVGIVEVEVRLIRWITPKAWI